MRRVTVWLDQGCDSDVTPEGGKDGDGRDVLSLSPAPPKAKANVLALGFERNVCRMTCTLKRGSCSGLCVCVYLRDRVLGG